MAVQTDKITPVPSGDQPAKRMGVTSASCGIRLGQKPPMTALDFLDYCHRLGAGGIQFGVGTWDKNFISQLRSRAESYRMYFEGQVRLPDDGNDVERFENQMRTAKEAGAKVVRAVTMNGRRYETFRAIEAFREFRVKAAKSLALAEPVARQTDVRLAIENHKDWRVPELLELLGKISSPHLGICLDIGNSIALLEDPMRVVEACAPQAFSVHFKDMGVEEYEDGFLLSEVPLGEGFLDLPKMVEKIRTANPQIEFNLEMITRDPLKVPCLQPHYWITLESLPAKTLAETLQLVRAHRAKKPLPRVDGLPLAEKVEAEEENNRRCLEFARAHLGL